MRQWSLLIFFPLILSCSGTYSERTHVIQRADLSLPPSNLQPFLPRHDQSTPAAYNLSSQYAPEAELRTGTGGKESSDGYSTLIYQAGNDNYHIKFGGSGLSASVTGYSSVDYSFGLNCIYLNNIWLGRLTGGLRIQRELSGIIVGAGVTIGSYRALVDYSETIITIDSLYDYYSSNGASYADTTEQKQKGREQGMFTGLVLGASIPGERITPFAVWTIELPSGHFTYLPGELSDLFQQTMQTGLEYRLGSSKEQTNGTWYWQFAIDLQIVSTQYSNNSQLGLGARTGLTYR